MIPIYTFNGDFVSVADANRRLRAAILLSVFVGVLTGAALMFALLFLIAIS